LEAPPSVAITVVALAAIEVAPAADEAAIVAKQDAVIAEEAAKTLAAGKVEKSPKAAADKKAKADDNAAQKKIEVAAAQKIQEDLAAAQRTAEIIATQNAVKSDEAAITLAAEKGEKAWKAVVAAVKKSEAEARKKRHLLLLMRPNIHSPPQRNQKFLLENLIAAITLTTLKRTVHMIVQYLKKLLNSMA
jgi:hypothetical protein